MRRTYYDKKTLPVPINAYMNLHEGTVFIKIHDQSTGKTPARQTDRSENENEMYPNEFFRQACLDIWEKHYGKDDLLPHELGLGMYALMFEIAEKLLEETITE